MTFVARVSPLLLLLGAVVTACGGKIDEGDLAVDDAASGLALENPSTPAPDDDTTGDDGSASGGEVGDRDCSERDHDGHGRHHRHKFSVLDALDGARDGRITIASLPPGLPPRLLEKLAKIDTDHDGIVTRAEVKAFRKHHRHHGRRSEGDDREPDHDDGEHADED